ncbi:MAG: prepilin-type N-terminal cleavage/methylation domain-containing protein [Candidatus Wildermuthbacteria bacterium]|nr:prepilin-type N-terminal cleavage/methylation domain-containing protein [Candidatus Wildermuthbacteria bacterium]
MKFNFYQKGFTLVELLVVIAIIGVLASIVSVSLQNPQKQASLAVAKRFYSQIDHALGFYAAGKWSLDDGSGATIKDNSGYGNTGTLSHSTMWRTESQCNLGFGGCLDFNGTDNRVTFSKNFNINGAMTISFWFNTPDNITQNQYLMDTRDAAGNNGPWWLIKNYNVASGKCIYQSQNPGKICFENRLVVQGTDWKINEWNHLVVVDQLSGSKIYMNGKLVDTGTGESATVPSTLKIGTRYNFGQWYNGMLDEVRIYSEALTTAQIQNLYAEGLKTHQQIALQP